MPDIESIHMPNVFFYDHSSTLQVTGVIACRHCVSPSSLSSDILYLYRRCETKPFAALPTATTKPRSIPCNDRNKSTCTSRDRQTLKLCALVLWPCTFSCSLPLPYPLALSHPSIIPYYASVYVTMNSGRHWLCW